MAGLLEALTDLCKAATAYLNAQTEGPQSPAVSEPAPGAPAVPKKERKSRAPKEEIAQAPKPEIATEELTEEQSLKELYSVCTAFVQRFQKGSPDGQSRAKAYLSEQFKVAKLADLVHAQRLQFIVWLKAEIEKGA